MPFSPAISCISRPIRLWETIISSLNSFTRLLAARPPTSRANEIWACCLSDAFLRND